MWEIVAALAKQALVERRPDPSDRRKLLIVASERGKELVAGVLASREAWLTRAVAAVTDQREHQVLHEAAALLDRLAEYHQTDGRQEDERMSGQVDAGSA
jgi:DNA-binding MarR family transcriptional regulator